MIVGADVRAAVGSQCNASTAMYDGPVHDCPVQEWMIDIAVGMQILCNLSESLLVQFQRRISIATTNIEKCRGELQYKLSNCSMTDLRDVACSVRHLQ